MSLSHTSGLTDAAMEKLREEYAKTLLEKAVAAQQAQQTYTSTQAHLNAHQQALANSGNITLAAGTGASWTTLGMHSSPIPIEVTQHNLDEGAWDVPVSQLVDLWVVRYGSKWVDESDLDEFYEIAARRLRALHKVESHYVNGKDVYRIVE